MAAETALETTKEVKRFLPGKFKYKGHEWTTLSMCGEGTFSSCFRVSNGNRHPLALKAYKTNTKYTAAFVNELRIFAILEDGFQSQKDFRSYFVKFIDSFTLSEHKCIMMDLLGCNLTELLIQHEMKGFSAYLIKRSLHDLLSAVVFLEGLGLVHGDIKPTNILWNMNSNCFQIIDFGLSFKTGEQPRQPLQSPGFQSPEVLQWNKEITEAKLPFSSQETSHIFDSSIDLWAIGCVTVYVSTGQQVYSTEHSQQLPLLCANCEFKSGACNHSQKSKTIISSIRNILRPDDFDNLADVLSGLLQCCPGNRLLPQMALKHPFLTINKAPEPSITDLLLLPSKILRLMNMFHTTIDEDDAADILCDIREECEEIGQVVSITAQKKSGLGREHHVYVEFKYAEDCEKAQRLLTGRHFDSRLVVATFFPVKDFLERTFY